MKYVWNDEDFLECMNHAPAKLKDLLFEALLAEAAKAEETEHETGSVRNA